MKKTVFLPQVVLAVSLSLMLACALRLPSGAQHVDQKQQTVKPILVKPKGYVPLPVSPESKKGEQYYALAHCSACHSINDEGSFVGPMLDGVGQHRNADFLYARLADTPAAKAIYAKLTGQNGQNLSPHVRLSSDMAHSLVAFLLTLPEPSGGVAVYRHATDFTEQPQRKSEFHPAEKTESSEDGKKLYDKFGCAQCHQIQHAGGPFGPALDGTGEFYSRDYIVAHITDAQAHAVTQDKYFELVPTSMPKFNATPEEIQKIAAYLMTLPELP